MSISSSQRRSIATQVAMLATAVFFVGIAAFSFLSYYRAAASLDSRWEDDLGARVHLMAGQLNVLDSTAKINADRLAKVFESLMPGPVRVDATRSIAVADKSGPVATAGGEVLNLDFRTVDTFSRLTGGNATVFVRTGDDFLRVTTSVKKEDGSRAMGPLLDRKHPAYESMLAGKPYLGRATLFGRHYMARYSPVADESGRTVAILYVGFDITDSIAALIRQIEESRIGDGGHFFVMDGSTGKDRGLLVVDRDAKGRNALSDPSLAGYRAALEKGEGSVISGDRMFAVTRFEPWGRVVGASMPLDELRADAASLRNVLLAFGVIVLALGSAATYVVLRRKLRPLAQLAVDAGRIGAGDLTVRSAATSNDEVGLLAAAFNTMADQISGIIVRVKSASTALAESVRNVQRESALVHAGSETQSEAASRVAAALEEVSASLESVAANAHDSQNLSKRTNDLSARGESVAIAAADETAAIAAAVRETAGAIGQLSQRSEEISKVVNVIKGIAEQTNLLALNAAIEAARAGEQGRGFAVVADEVRQLAERTGQSTIEIGRMIGAIQQETDGAVHGMRASSERVDAGVKLVHEAVTALKEIRVAAAETLTKAGDISRAMDEHSAAGLDISNNVEKIAAMADENNAAADRNNATVAQLEGLAAELAALTAGLKVAA